MGTQPQAGRSTARRRGTLLAIIAVGTVITLVSGVGIFAALTDRATTGVNDVESAAEPDVVEESVDLQLAMATFDVNDGSKECGTFSEDLATGLFTGAAGELQPGPTDLGETYLCLKNVGSGTAAVTWAGIDLLESEVGCTGTEATQDATCGPARDHPGELGQFVHLARGQADCNGPSFLGESADTTITALASTPESFAQIGAGEVSCFLVRLSFHPTDADADLIRAAQSDRVTWRLAFDGSVIVP